jgi:hypothetical protein
MSSTPRSNWLRRPPVSPMHHKVLCSVLLCKAPCRQSRSPRHEGADGAPRSTPVPLQRLRGPDAGDCAAAGVRPWARNGVQRDEIPQQLQGVQRQLLCGLDGPVGCRCGQRGQRQDPSPSLGLWRMVHRVGLDHDRQVRLSTPRTLAPANDALSVSPGATSEGMPISPSSPTSHDEGCTLRRASYVQDGVQEGMTSGVPLRLRAVEAVESEPQHS